MDEKGHDREQERGIEVVEAARRLFASGDRFAGSWFDQHRRYGLSVSVCAVAPTQDEVEELDATAAAAGFPLTVVPVKYSKTLLLGLYEAVSDRELPAACAKFGIDAMHNALRLVLRHVDDEALAFFLRYIPSDALRVEIEPRAGHNVALPRGT